MPLILQRQGAFGAAIKQILWRGSIRRTFVNQLRERVDAAKSHAAARRVTHRKDAAVIKRIAGRFEHLDLRERWVRAQKTNGIERRCDVRRSRRIESER